MWWKNVTSSGGLKRRVDVPDRRREGQVRVRLDQARHHGVAGDVDDGVALVEVRVMTHAGRDDAASSITTSPGAAGAPVPSKTSPPVNTVRPMIASALTS